MGSRRFSHFISKAPVVAIFAVVAMLVSAAPVSTTKVLYSFRGSSDGGYPDTDLVMDSTGRLYGSAVEGGAGSGAVFKLTPSTSGWTQSVLYSFQGFTDGGEPYGGVALDAQGNLYGTAVTGGTGPCEGGCGVVYKLTYSNGTWTQSVIHNFAGGNDGTGAGAGVTFDRNGNMYGMTATGGAYGAGIIYQLHPDRHGNWQEKIIHTFTGGDDGGNPPIGRLLVDLSGNLWGVATTGGANGAGTAFKVSPTPNGEWNFKTLYAFKGQPDAGFPYGALVFDTAGNLYGTTYYNGANGIGTVYKLTHKISGWEESVLYNFQGGTDGAYPLSNLVFDAKGNLYGTTSDGGTGSGTIFKLAPGSNGQWTESVIHTFTGPPDGNLPYNGMVADSAGNFYGTTVHGGIHDEGAIFKFTP